MVSSIVQDWEVLMNEIPGADNARLATHSILGGSWGLASKVFRTLIEVISIYKYSYLTYIP